MRKVIGVLIALLVFCSYVQASDLEDTRAEQSLLTLRLQHYTEVSQNIRVRLLELQGIIKYLEQKDKETLKIKDELREMEAAPIIPGGEDELNVLPQAPDEPLDEKLMIAPLIPAGDDPLIKK